MELAEAPLKQTSSHQAPPDNVVIGVLVGTTGDGIPLVSFAGCEAEAGYPARTTVPIGAMDVGKQVVLLFEANDFEKPLVMGKLHEPDSASELVTAEQQPLSAEVDGERITLSAEREIVLKCGKASITLTRAGKVILKGAYVSSRSSGVNKIKGGSVQIN